MDLQVATWVIFRFLIIKLTFINSKVHYKTQRDCKVFACCNNILKIKRNDNAESRSRLRNSR